MRSVSLRPKHSEEGRESPSTYLGSTEDVTAQEVSCWHWSRTWACRRGCPDRILALAEHISHSPQAIETNARQKEGMGNEKAVSSVSQWCLEFWARLFSLDLGSGRCIRAEAPGPV